MLKKEDKILSKILLDAQNPMIADIPEIGDLQATDLFLMQREGANYSVDYNTITGGSISKISSNIAITVGINGDYQTIDDALNYLSGFLPVFVNNGFTATVELLNSGDNTFHMETPINISNLDLSWITFIGKPITFMPTNGTAFTFFNAKSPQFSISGITSANPTTKTFVKLSNNSSMVIKADEFSTDMTISVDSGSDLSTYGKFTYHTLFIANGSKLYANTLTSPICLNSSAGQLNVVNGSSIILDGEVTVYAVSLSGESFLRSVKLLDMATTFTCYNLSLSTSRARILGSLNLTSGIASSNTLNGFSILSVTTIIGANSYPAVNAFHPEGLVITGTF